MVEKKVEIKYQVKDEASKNVKGLTKNVSMLGKSFSMAKSLLLGPLGLVFGIGAFVKGLSSAVSASNQQENAINKLTESMKNNGTFTLKARDAVLSLASARQKVTRYGDEESIAAAALLNQYTKLTGQGLEKALIATQDLAAAKGIDLKSAADLVGKSLGSETNALGRYGVKVDGLVGSTERLTSLTQNMSSVFGGSALADAKTFSGQVDMLSNRYSDLTEKVGDVVKVLLSRFMPVANSVIGFLEKITNSKRVNKWSSDFKTGISGVKLGFNLFLISIKQLGIGFDSLVSITAQSFDKIITTATISGLKLKGIFKETKEEQEQVQKEYDEREQKRSESLLTKSSELNTEKINAYNEFRSELQSITEEYNALEIETEQIKQDEINKIKNKAIKEEQKRIKDELLIDKAKKDILLNAEKTFGGLMTLTASSGNKELFNITKAASVATATIKGIESISQSWASASFPWNLPAVAASTTAAAVNVGQIQAVNPQFANGGLVQPSSGGTTVTMGEAGQQELGLPSGKVQSFLDEAGVGQSVPVEVSIILDKKVLVKALTSGQRKGERNKTL